MDLFYEHCSHQNTVRSAVGTKLEVSERSNSDVIRNVTRQFTMKF